MADSALFCSVCGQKQIAEEGRDDALAENVEAVEASATSDKEHTGEKPKKKVLKGVFPLVKGAILLLLSVLMLITVFLPVYVVEIPYVDAEVDMYLLDSVVFLSDALKKSEGIDSKLESKYASLQAELNKIIQNEGYEGSSEYARLLEDLFKVSLRRSYQSEGLISPMHVVSVSFAAIQILLAVAFFVLSVLGFINSFSRFKLGNGKIERISMRLFVYSTFSFILGSFILDSFFADTGKMNSSVIIMLVLSVTTILGLIISSKILQKKLGSVKKFVLTLVSVFLCVMVIAFTFSSVFVSEAAYKGIELKHKAGFFDSFILSESQKEEYKAFASKGDKMEYISGIFDFFEYDAEEINMHSTATLLIMYAAHSQSGFMYFSWAYAFIPVMYLLVLVGALLILSEKALYLLTDSSLKITALLSKIFLPIFCALALALIILFLIIVNYKLNSWLAGKYIVKISASAIALIVCAVATVCIPSGDKKVKE